MYRAVDLLTNRPFLDILSFSCHISLQSELLFNNLTKRLFINSYTSRNWLYTILPPHQTTFHQFVHLTKSIVYYSTTSPNDFSSIRTPHEIDYILFYHLTKRLFINSYTSRNQLYYSTTSPNDFSSMVVEISKCVYFVICQWSECKGVAGHSLIRWGGGRLLLLCWFQLGGGGKCRSEILFVKKH